jgi:hypothetical protein
MPKVIYTKTAIAALGIAVAFLESSAVDRLWQRATGKAQLLSVAEFSEVYPILANGDVAPRRVIRSAEDGKKSLRFGKTQALAYDSTREQILVPN